MKVIGLLYLVVLFIACFFIVHFVKLAFIGFKSLKRKPPEQKEVPPQKTEPVYYIVERKRARKSSYSAPKEIQFKDDK